jgi:hypothetical protein
MGMNLDPAVTGLVGGALLGAALSRGQHAVQPPPMQKPEPAPQPSRQPDASQTLADMQARAAAQPSTFLTGPGGVDPKRVRTIRPSLYPVYDDDGGESNATNAGP